MFLGYWSEASGLDRLRTLRLKGKVCSGKGEGAKFVDLAWVRKQMEETLGFTLFPGTLNLKLTEDSKVDGKLLNTLVGFEIVPHSGCCRAKFFKARMSEVDCAVIVPAVAGYPEDLVEVVASVNLREKLGFFDGRLVELKVII